MYRTLFAVHFPFLQNVQYQSISLIEVGPVDGRVLVADSLVAFGFALGTMEFFVLTGS
jgi:hypothetical protein